MMAETLLRPAQVAEMFGVTPKTVTRWADAGHLPCIVTPGGHRRYPERIIKLIVEKRNRA